MRPARVITGSAATVCMALVLSQPAAAQTLKTLDCTSANIASTTEAISKMIDARQKKLASDEIGSASEAMAQGKTDECKDHLLKASLQTK